MRIKRERLERGGPFIPFRSLPWPGGLSLRPPPALNSLSSWFLAFNSLSSLDFLACIASCRLRRSSATCPPKLDNLRWFPVTKVTTWRFFVTPTWGDDGNLTHIFEVVETNSGSSKDYTNKTTGLVDNPVTIPGRITPWIVLGHPRLSVAGPVVVETPSL